MLRHVGCCWLKFEEGQIFHATFGQVRSSMLRLGMHTSSIFNSQHLATRCNRVAKRTQHVAPNNVAICCVEMLRSFGRGLIFNLRILREFTLIQFVYTVRNIPNLTEYLRWRQISKKKFKNWPPSRICGRTWLFHVDGKEMNKKL